MRNDTTTKITIEMSHVDNSFLFMKFLNELKKRGGRGGDLNITIEDDSGDPVEFFLGHDVNFSVDKEYVQ